MRQLATESIAVALAGGVAGVVLAVFGVRLFRALAPAGIPRLGEVSVDIRVAGFAVALSLLTGLVLGRAAGAQGSRRWLSVAARHDGRDAGALIERIRDAVLALDPTLPIPESGTLDRHVVGSLVEPRFYAMLLATFATLAALIAAVGLCGTIAYSVRLRGRELGIRLAFGATRRELRRAFA